MALVAALALLALYLIPAPRPHHAALSFVSDGVTVSVLTGRLSDKGRCEVRLAAMERALTGSRCPACVVTQSSCTPNLTPWQADLLRGKGLDFATLHAQGLAMTFEGGGIHAEQVCHETARRIPGARCLPAKTAALASALGGMAVQAPAASLSGSLMRAPLVAAAFTALACLLVILTTPLHGRYSLDRVGSGPQKVHAKAVPRLGGVAIIVGLVAGTYLASPGGPRPNSGLWLLLAASLPAFAGGLAEDLTRRVGVLPRFLLTISAGLLASVLLGATVRQLDLPLFDWALSAWPVLAVALTAFAVGGVANSVNIIDGFDGLAGGFALVASTAVCYVAYQVGDRLVLEVCLVLAGCCVGFLVLNWPGGRIFLGDGGAYLVGFLLAAAVILLSERNPNVSPWFALAVLILPIWETLHSVIRRGAGGRWGSPDSRHLHHLVHRRLRARFGGQIGSGQARAMVAPLLLSPVALVAFLATAFHSNTQALMALCVLTVIALSYLSRALSKDKL
jgi:UDP-GlcNAc:undecaprenyl-phosphate GlcNAc-1-phosphate transferase